MRIDWAPWNVSLEKRLQTLAVCVQMSLLIFGEITSIMFIAVCLVCNLKFFFLLKKNNGICSISK